MKQNHGINLDNLIELAGFTINHDQKEKLSKEIDEFLAYAEIINQASSDDYLPASHAVAKDTSIRNDQHKAWERLDALLTNAPAIKDTSYLVPPQKGREGKDIEKEETGTNIKTNEYEAVIGLEVHAQLRTKSKLFCSCSTEFGKSPNENTCPVCAGQPGVLPVLNKEAVNMAIRTGLAVNGIVNKTSIFARKNYFYPDLPKAYQISQFEEPIITGGKVIIEINETQKKIRLNRIHIEEDAGKMVHVGAPGIWGSKASAVDFNRCSVPLIEIVSEPDMSTPQEAKEYVIMLRAILMGLQVCDGNMEEGSLRCDANVSIRKVGDKKLGTKTEVKNMNSFKAIERALIFEIERQKKMVSNGIPIEQETRLWDDAGQKTILMRSKEESHDYRYFPDPDLLPITLTENWIDDLRKTLPPMPWESKEKYISNYEFTEDEALVFIHNPDYASFFETILKHYNKPRATANWFFSELLSYISGNIDEIHLKPVDVADFLLRIEKGEISGKIGKSVLKKAFAKNKGLIQIIEEEGLKQIDDPEEISRIIDEIIQTHPDQVAEYKSGKAQVFGYLIGQVMKKSQGKASPGLVNRIMKEKLK